MYKDSKNFEKFLHRKLLDLSRNDLFLFSKVHQNSKIGGKLKTTKAVRV